MPQRIGGFDQTDIRRGKGGGAGKQHFPFEITKGTDPDGNPYVRVRPGLVSGLIPDNISDKIYISKFGTFYIKLTCQTNGKIPTYVFLFSDSEPTDNEDVTSEGVPPPTFEVILGVVVNGRPYQIIFNNILAVPNIAFVEPTEQPNAAQEPFTRWWNWKISYF